MALDRTSVSVDRPSKTPVNWSVYHSHPSTAPGTNSVTSAVTRPSIIT
jgi:hypothetical protein